ncbi:glycosyltransferase family 1 protein [Rurimicrobium arvi]|uniref:Glycosyltransferase family 1 protein n=1 Tax=Rurimicrobium arvi TaxID=2049916 RepID=A0ABP8MRD7_9BACT
MKIAVNTRLLLKGKLEGIGWFSYQTLKILAARHPEHEFIFIFDRPYSDEFIFGKNVTPVVIGPPARHPVLFYLWLDWSVSYVLRKYKADVFLSPDGFASMTTKVPTCLVIHDLAFEHFPDHQKKSHSIYFRHFTPKFARKAKRIVTVSEFSKQDIASRYHINPDKIAVSNNAAHDAYHPVSWQEREQIKQQYAQGCEYFLFTGALHPRKNVVNLLKAFIRFKKRNGSNMKLVIVGRLAWNYAEVADMKEHMPFKEDVVWPGYLEIDELARVTAGAYALVYASLFEGFGIPIVEAFQCGVPAIVSNTSSMPEVAGAAALIADPNDYHDIAEKMSMLYRDEQLREQLVSKTKEEAARYTWEKAADVLWENILLCRNQ